MAAATDGASGSDLRKLVRATVLAHGETLTTDDLCAVAVTDDRWRELGRAGQYL